METKEPPGTRSGSLDNSLRPFFWDTDFGALEWKRDRDFVIGRVLSVGDWQAVTSVRARVGDRGLRTWIQRHRGRGLSPQQLRFWELILDLPGEQVEEWLAEARRVVWDNRTQG